MNLKNLGKYRIVLSDGEKLDKKGLSGKLDPKRNWFRASRGGVIFFGRVEIYGTEYLLIVEDVFQSGWGWVQD